VPSLRGNVCAGQAKNPKELEFPSVALISTRAKYFPDQSSLHSCPTPSTAVFNIGKFEATVVLRIGAANNNTRYELEDAVLCLFFQDQLRPGIIKYTIADCESALVAWELEEVEWEDEKVFDNKWYSVITATLFYPALVKKTSTYAIDQIKLNFTEDFTTAASALGTGDFEQIVIT